ncbi:MAG: IPT/TIG domain-containing protein [Blastocatellia bacterium]
MFHVGPNQINYIVPSDTELDGTATVVVTDAQGITVAQGELAMAARSLNIFTSNQAGTGAPAAVFTADGNAYSNVTNGDGSMNVVPPGNYLVLFGTGVRAGRDIKAFIGGVEAQVDYAGAQQQYVALDQINIKVPDSLTGQGVLDVVITDGLTLSNVVTIDVGGNPQAPSGAPVITGFSASEVYAGQVVTVTGSQFPTVLSDASVKLGSTSGQIVSTNATAMSFIVPYGAATNKVTVGNAVGARKSTATLTVKTSVSGTILDGQGNPVVGMPVNVLSAGVGASTDSAGRFLIPDVPRGIAQVQVDTSQFPANLGLPMMTYSLVVTDGTDNEIGYPIYLPASLGTSVIFSSMRAANGTYRAVVEGATPVVLEHNGLRLEIPGTVTFPAEAKDTTVKVTRLPASSWLPAPLPSGIYPSVVGMITPFGATFGDKTSGMATLYFPNPDKFPAGAKLDLYAFRPNVAPSGFVKKGTATVDANGEKIVAAGLIDLATIWFVGLPSDQVTFTSVVGTVVDGSQKPVNKARVFVRGRSAVTDQNGKFEIKGVRADNNDDLRVEAKFFTPAGDALATFKLVKAVVPGPTDAGTLQFPALPSLSILIRPMEAKTKPGVAIDMGVVLSRKLSADATINLTNEDGVKLNLTPATLTVPAGQTEAAFKVKGDLPGKGTVIAKLAAPVDDATPDNSRKGAAVVYVINPAPVLAAIQPVSGAPGSAFTLTGTGLGTEAGQNTVFFKQGDRIAVVDPKLLKATVSLEAAGNVTLTGVVPGLRAGDVEVYVSVLRNGVPSELSNKIKFTVTQAVAPKLESITPNSGAPGATFTLIGTGLDANPKNLGIFFKQGDKIIPSPVELLKVISATADDPTKPATIQGVVPRMPAGDAEVFAVVYRNGAPSEPSNKLAFKVLTPPGPTLESVTPAEGAPGATFTIKGSNFDPDAKRNFVFLKQNDRIIQLDPSTIKFDGQSLISGVVPRIALGGYEIFVVTNLESTLTTAAGKLPGTPSNGLPFKVVAPPPAKLDAIDPVESLPGKTFTIKGSGWGDDVRKFRVIFKQTDRWLLVEPANIKFDQTMITGVLPNFPAGDYEVLVVTSIDLIPATNTTPPGVPSNSLKFKILSPPAPVLETITPTEALPGTAFKLTGKNFKQGITVAFRQSTQNGVIAPEQLKVTDTTIEGVVPNLPAGGAEVVAFFTTAQLSNPLPFKVLGTTLPPPVLETIAPVEGAPGSPFKLTGKNFLDGQVVYFKQGDKMFSLPSAALKFTATTIEGVLPQMPPGAAEVAVGFGQNQFSNALPFKFLLPPGAQLASLDPTQGLPRTAFAIKGIGFAQEAKNNQILFKQGDKFQMIDPALNKLENGVLSALVPDVAAGDYEVIVMTNLWLGTPGTNTPPGVPSNGLKFTVLPPPAPVLETIAPTEGAPGTPFKLTGKNFPTNLRLIFKQGDIMEELGPDRLKITSTTIDGILPGIPPGGAEVFVMFGQDGKTNILPFKFLAVANLAQLNTISPTQLVPGGAFKLTGSNLAPFYTVVFKQGDIYYAVPRELLKFTDGTMIEGSAPGVPAGAAEVFVAYGNEAVHVKSNSLPVTMLAPPQVTLESITSVDGKPEGIPGNTFKITGKNLAPFYNIVFKQGDKTTVIEAFQYKVVDGVIVGMIPDLPANTTDVFLTLGTQPASVILKFLIKPKV